MTGQILGHYRVHESIGAGGMGEVYRATDHRLNREVALKLLKSTFVDEPDRLRRFKLEAQAAAALNHPNIVAIYDIGESDGASFIVSELLQGSTLRRILQDGPLPLRTISDYAQQIAQGLAAAHEKHIVHRDLKPENIFITREGRAKILDFGIAKLIAEDVDDPALLSGMTTQTKAGSILGTVAYMSPEQLRGKPVDHRSDIFSFGAILFEMLTGKRAFSGETQVDTMTAVLKDDPPEIAMVRDSVPAGFEQIVRHCLEKEPENRFQSAIDLAFALKSVSDLPSKPERLKFKSGHRKRTVIAWIAAALVVAALGIYVGERITSASAPAYRRLTFERGTVYSARFTSDGRSVVYGASWNGRPMQIYFSPAESVSARPLDLNSAHMLSLSHTNELALIIGGRHGSGLDFVGGTLARAPLAGGAPREILSDVRSADWNNKGELAVVHHVPGRNRLEFPIGKVLYETTGWIANIRFSPDGSKIAFLDYPVLYDDRGSVSVTDLSGHRTVLSTGWESEEGLAWSPESNAIWFTASDKDSSSRALWSVDLAGKQRKVLEIPGAFTLQDIAPDGRVLVSLDTSRVAMEWSDKRGVESRDLSWYDWSVAKDISRDGQWVLFEESAEPAGSNHSIAYRKIDGSLPIGLGGGSGGALSPDGKWAVGVITATPQHLVLMPTSTGEPRDLAVPGLNLQSGAAHFLPDGKHVVFNGNEAGHSGRTYEMDVDNGRFHAVTPEGNYAIIPSPDGKYLAGGGSDGRLMLFPIRGGDPIPVRGLDPNFSLAQWSADGKSFFVYRDGEVPTQIYRFHLDSGRIEVARSLIPSNRAGVVSIAPIVTNPSADAFLYSYLQTMSVLYVISGLK